jgi:tetratricopeptide (TPR) repeat protein
MACDGATRLGRGVALQDLGRHAEALEHFRAAQQAMTENPAPFLRAAASLLALGRAREAVRAASDACHRAPELPEALHVYGQAWLAVDEPARAEQAFAHALKAAPAWPEAWVDYGIARYRQGAIEAAKTAMRQALRHAPDHPAASAHLAEIEKAASDADVRPTADEARLCAFTPDDPDLALAISVKYLMMKPVFAGLPFGNWSAVLVGQINRGHLRFVVDEDGRVHGLLGWALTNERLAEDWVVGRAQLPDEDCRDGDCVIVNVWAADSAAAHRLLVEEARKLFGHTRWLYAKRYRRNGHQRPMRHAFSDISAAFALLAPLPRVDDAAGARS